MYNFFIVSRFTIKGIHLQSSILSQALIQSVSEQYERFPYPNYPLLAKPRCADGFMGTADFASALCRIRRKPGIKKLLIAGCGEILPYVLRQLEARDHDLVCIDLSKRSLRRAHIRCLSPLNLLHRNNLHFEQIDLDAYLSRSLAAGNTFHHFDAYGVLQCLPNPAQTLEKIAAVLAPEGTMRIMVYNNQARTWIHAITKIFQLLHLDYRDPDDLRQAQGMLSLMHAELPFMQRIFSGGLASIVRNRARLVDTFFHQRDISYSLADWFAAIEQAGLRLVGLVDRYGELDDLKNPLWYAPSLQALIERAADFRFENNLEFYLTKASSLLERTEFAASLPHKQRSLKSIANGFREWRLFLPTLPLADSYTYPKLWFSFSETRSIPSIDRLRIWQAHRDYTLKNIQPSPKIFKPYPLRTLQRLARLGAILPGMLDQSVSAADLCQPLSEKMQAPVPSLAVNIEKSNLVNWLRTCLVQKKVYSEKRLQLILLRLKNAQAIYTNDYSTVERSTL